MGQGERSHHPENSDQPLVNNTRPVVIPIMVKPWDHLSHLRKRKNAEERITWLRASEILLRN
jgi:hypothetical protein